MSSIDAVDLLGGAPEAWLVTNEETWNVVRAQVPAACLADRRPLFAFDSAKLSDLLHGTPAARGAAGHEQVRRTRSGRRYAIRGRYGPTTIRSSISTSHTTAGSAGTRASIAITARLSPDHTRSATTTPAAPIMYAAENV